MKLFIAMTLLMSSLAWSETETKTEEQTSKSKPVSIQIGSENKKFGRTLLLNPGSVCGIIDGKPAKASYAIYDTKTNSANIIEVK